MAMGKLEGDLTADANWSLDLLARQALVSTYRSGRGIPRVHFGSSLFVHMPSAAFLVGSLALRVCYNRRRCGRRKSKMR